MLEWQELSQQLQQIANAIVRFAKARKREEATIGLAAILFWFGYFFPKWLTPEIKDWVNSWHGLLIIPSVFYVVGVILFTYGCYRIWLLVHTPDLPPPRDRPSAVKGPIAFTPADGELFRRLGREDELGRLLGFIEDDQVRLVVVMGASGVGKTSLLRAGLTNILKNKGIDYHYWEAVPTAPGQRLLRAIQESWQSGPVREANGAANAASFAKPESLEDLVNPSSALGERRHVIVLDQFEQLHGSSANSPVFRLLRKIAREAKPPHRVTWIVAFRREFRAEWEDLTLPEKERGIYPAEISLRLFTAEQARYVISQLVDEARLSIHQKVVDSLVSAATVDGEVSPVDIGIGLLVLAELHDRQGRETFTLDDYQFAGGAEGLLTQYISRCLETFPETERKTILNAMLALRESGTNQRIAEGRTCPELAQESKADADRLRIQLERLTQRDIRLLEIVIPSDESEVRYRLPHERLIPALHRLAGQLLAEVDQTRLRFENAFTAWKNSGGKARYLLNRAELRAVERYERQITWGKGATEKRAFLQRSQRRRALGRLRLTAALIFLIGVGGVIYRVNQRNEDRRIENDARTYLKDNNYPPELYDWQRQLKILRFNDPMPVQRFPWLHSDTLEEFTIEVQKGTNSLDGLVANLTKCRALKRLSLNLFNSEVNDFTPLTKLTGLTQLSLVLREDQESNLTPLAKLTGLKQLSLTGRQVSNLTALLANLRGLTQLRLDLRYFQLSDLLPLTKQTGLKELSLNLSGGKVSELTPLADLTGLTQLTLDLRDSQPSALISLPKLTGVKKLTLNLTASKVSDLTPLTRLTGLTELTLALTGSQVEKLTPLTNLNELTELTLTASKVEELTPLTSLKGLTQLTLDLSDSQVDLMTLPKLNGHTQLSLRVSDSQMSKLTLTNLTGLRQLTLDLSQVSDLTPLAKLTGLRQLTLNFGSQVSDLTPLAKLTGLKQLTLYFFREVQVSGPPLGSQVSDLTPLAKLTGLTQLTLSLGGSQVSNLTPLTTLNGLTQLNLDLSTSQVSDLTPVTNLNSCETLVLRANTNQRKALKAIPPGLTHLEF